MPVACGMAAEVAKAAVAAAVAAAARGSGCTGGGGGSRIGFCPHLSHLGLAPQNRVVQPRKQGVHILPQ